MAGRTFAEMEGTTGNKLTVKWDRVYAMVMKYDTDRKGPTARQALFQSWLASIGIIHEEKVIEPSSPSGKVVRYQVFKKAA
jgi:hypothetical protein